MAGKKNQESAGDSLAQLKEDIRSGRLGSIYLFSGEERFLLDHYVKEIKRLILKDDENGLNNMVFEGKTGVGDIMDACDTFPIFSERKLVMVKQSGLFSLKKGKSAPDSQASVDADEEDHPSETDNAGNKNQERLKNYLSEVPQTTCLLFVEDSVDKRTGLYKTVQKLGLHVDFQHLKPDELVKWVMRGFAQSKKRISEDIAQYLVSICEPDMYAIRNEIFKVDLLTGDRVDITIDDINRVASVTIKRIIFDLMDAVASKNRVKALAYLDDMLALREPEQKIFAMIAKQTGELLKLKKLVGRGVPQTQLTRFFGKKHPYALRKLIDQAGQMDAAYLEKMLAACMEYDLAAKRGKLDIRLGLEIMLTNL